MHRIVPTAQPPHLLKQSTPRIEERIDMIVRGTLEVRGTLSACAGDGQGVGLGCKVVDSRLTWNVWECDVQMGSNGTPLPLAAREA